MITITVKEKQKQITNICFKGHALYDDYGKDIVCAGASAILITTVNAIIKYDENAIKYEQKKDFNLTILKWDNIINILINNMLDLLDELKSTYPKNLQIKRRKEE